MFNVERSCAEVLDQQDGLAPFRDAFEIPRFEESNRSRSYFCGHSLGLMPKQARETVNQVLDQWSQLGARGYFQGEHAFVSYHEALTEGLAQLVGAKPEEVVAMNTLTVNLHLMMISFFRPNQKRYKIVIESHAFPSDRYAVHSHLRHHNLDPEDALIELSGPADDACIDEQSLLDLLDSQSEEIALLLLPGVQYYTGQVLDMAAITEAAHAKGIKVGFDLAHAVGNIPLHSHEWGFDFACWCHYKYVNSGPGAVAGCFIHHRHLNDPQLCRFAGWWGHDKSSRFAMPEQFLPIGTAEGWLLSCPSILSMAPLRAALGLVTQAGGIEVLREKSRQLTGYLAFLVKALLAEFVTVITPSNELQRGCQLSLVFHNGGRRIYQYLLDQGVDVDWREPNVIRIAPVPLYNRFIEVFELVNLMKEATGKMLTGDLKEHQLCAT